MGGLYTQLAGKGKGRKSNMCEWFCVSHTKCFVCVDQVAVYTIASFDRCFKAKEKKKKKRGIKRRVGENLQGGVKIVVQYTLPEAKIK